MSVNVRNPVMNERAVADLIERHRNLYDGPGIESKLKSIIQRNRMQVRTLFLHYIKCMAVENTHEPGAKWAARLETRQSSPCKQKCALSNLFSKCPLMTKP